MALFSKLSVGSATASEHKVFFWARMKLTGIYVLILAVILIGFSAILYQNFQQTLAEADDNDFAGPDFHQHFVDTTLSSVQNEIVLIDLVILLAAAGVSYVLAGYTLRPIQRSMEAQRMFSENASHELRTPLAVMKNDAEVFLRDTNPKKEMMQNILRSNIEEINRLSKMTEDLLALARSQKYTASTEERADITEVAQRITKKMHALAAKKAISMAVTKGDPLPVWGDTSRFERVFINLLQNAIEHTPAGGSIVVSTGKENGRGMFKVVDTGSGIDERELPRIFERFYKGGEMLGSGLGLSIVKEIIEQSRGRINVTSKKGEGTTVMVTLPLA